MAAETDHLIAHVQDSRSFDVPRFISSSGHLDIPQPFASLGLVITKFMLIELAIAAIMCLIFISVARRMAAGGPPKGRFWNMFEAMLLYIRDEIARPTIGHHEGDRFVPFLWTMFFFILFCNLAGMFPGMGTPTGAFGVTVALALVTFFVVVVAGSIKMGPLKFWIGQVPHLDVPKPILVILWPMIFVIEVVGMLVKHFVLSVRLLANMFAGHLVIAVILGFIAQTAASYLWFGVMPASLFGAFAVSLLELLVAFIQAYVFTFLASLFIGMAVHSH